MSACREGRCHCVSCFFSSRRRHTRCSRDWSSDVCSSDLDLALAGLPLLARVEAHKAGHALHTQLVSRLLADPSLWTITTGEAARPERDPYLTALSPAPATD